MHACMPMERESKESAGVPMQNIFDDAILLVVLFFEGEISVADMPACMLVFVCVYVCVCVCVHVCVMDVRDARPAWK